MANKCKYVFSDLEIVVSIEHLEALIRQKRSVVTDPGIIIPAAVCIHWDASMLLYYIRMGWLRIYPKGRIRRVKQESK